MKGSFFKLVGSIPGWLANYNFRPVFRYVDYAVAKKIALKTNIDNL